MRLTDADLLTELEQPAFAALRQAFVTKRYPKGCHVFSPREARNRLFIVVRGRARVYLASRDKEFTMAILDAGDVYTTHTRAHVAALDDLELLVADLAEVGRLLFSMPALSAAMVKVLGDLLAHAFTVIDGLAFYDVRRRLLHLLALEAGRAGTAADGAACCDLGLSVEQLATIVGSSRQTVSSLLNSLEREGVIALEGRGVIRVPDLAALRVLADA
ncbi:MAG: Crp/Fnr family transcriptional regulator [Solidesulfovibrio sp. DCME]|uniref:Crp/Fnr family transcriptional regulator n=1 Tax=Solidesulfovibrio sp. DCME TaxID=3447380 RepID=UPI003D1467F0